MTHGNLLNHRFVVILTLTDEGTASDHRTCASASGHTTSGCQGVSEEEVDVLPPDPQIRMPSNRELTGRNGERSLRV